MQKSILLIISLPRKEISYRKTKAIDIKFLCHQLSMTKLCQDSPDSLNDLVQCYNTTLAAAIDSHVVTKTIKVRPFITWIINDIKEARRERRRGERKWRRSGDISDLIVFKAKKNFTTHLMNKARFDFYKNFIDENRFHQRNIFVTKKRLLQQSNTAPFPFQR